ncbi:hypothetical protein JTB14_010507 [Gonioctena quinquepunctata]|nr:hypothetical protein JTB14_010507 [Gonioctena quinquepunctata]
MSVARQSAESKSIPIRQVLVKDPSELPSHYSSTPGGTLFSTTPGGTKIVYERAFLMNLRDSPISKTPPNFDIPEHLAVGSPSKNVNHGGLNKPRYHRGPQRRNSQPKNQQKNNEVIDDQFQIDL